MVELASNVITVAQARTLFATYVQQQINAMAPALRNNPVYITADPRTGQSIAFSYPQLLSEVQRGSSIGNNEAIKYAAAQGYHVA